MHVKIGSKDLFTHSSCMVYTLPMKHFEKRTCEHCQNSYDASENWQRFCTYKCRDAWHCAKRKKERLERKARPIETLPNALPEAP